MIDKKFPRKLNKSSDSRLSGADDMSDALNISTSEDTRTSANGNTGSGNAGVLKPLKSNTPLNEGFATFGDSHKTVVGKAICDKYNVIYFFVSDSSASGQSGIYAYDPDRYLPNSDGKNGLTKVFSDSRLVIAPDVFVKADITYIQRNYIVGDTTYEDVPFIFFTDNNAEPKKINVLRAHTGDYPSDGGTGIYDFMFACPKTPVHQIVEVDEEDDGNVGGWFNDTTMDANEFIGIEGFQFAYQNVYKDGQETAISSYSRIYVPPGYLQYSGVADVQILNQQNAIELIIPNDDMSGEVESVKLLARRGNDGSWFFIEEFPYEGTDIEFTFLNDTVNSAISRDNQIKQFDNLPRRAEAQTLMDNRLFYGNYLDGFDQAYIDSSLLTPNANVERDADFASYEIKVVESSCPSPSEYSGEGAQNKNIGFVIDAEHITTEIEAGSYINFSFTIAPKQNFHVYDAKNSYHQSPQMGEDFSKEGLAQNGILRDENWAENHSIQTQYGTDSFTGHPKGAYWQTPTQSGGVMAANQFKDFYKIPAICSDGVGRLNDGSNQSRYRWRHFDMAAGTTGVGDISQIDFGTSAANPFVIQGRPISVSCSFRAAKELTKKEAVRAVALILSGALPSRNENEPNEIDVLASDINYLSDDDLRYTIDLGLDNSSSFRETSSLANLITMVGPKFSKNQVQAGIAVGGTIEGPSIGGRFADDEEGAGGSAGDPNVINKGFFILNKADVEFGLFLDEGYNEEATYPAGQYSLTQATIIAEDNDKARARMGVYLKSVDVPNDEEAILSCVRRPLPGARWWCFAPWNQDGNDSFPAVENVLEGQADFREYSLFPFVYAGASAGGLQVNPSFSTAMGHNIDDPAFPQNALNGWDVVEGVDDRGGPNGVWDHPQEGFQRQRKETDIFKNIQLLTSDGQVGTEFQAPWAHVLGGLYYNQYYLDNYETIRFFDGEDQDGVSRFSLMDGKGGPGGGGVDSNSIYDNLILANAAGTDEDRKGVGTFGSAPLFSNGDGVSVGCFGPALTNNIMIGKMYPNSGIPTFLSNQGIANLKNPRAELQGGGILSDGSVFGVMSMPLMLNASNDLLGYEADQTSNSIGPYLNYEDFDNDGDLEEFQDDDPGYAKKLSNPQPVNTLLSVIAPGGAGAVGFKRGASHPLGVVFYDARGRCSDVTPIGSFYSPWYSETPGFESYVPSVSITLEGTPPEQATRYRYVYAGNTTMSRFVQYSTGGAFVQPESSGQFSGNVFVSLNHLQFSPASYAKSYGARSIDGSQDVYTFREGDRLRIISYYRDESTREFVPTSYEFNIVDQLLLGPGDDNPIYDENFDNGTAHKAKTGSFLVLENNREALGFDYQSVRDGEGDPNATSHFWGNRCVVEIYSPKTSEEEGALLYHEIGDVYDIADFASEEGDTIEGYGDTWWKTAAVNFQRFQQDQFKSIITNEEAEPNFFPYGIESQVFSPRVRNSDVWAKGKPKIVVPDAEEITRSSTITYSDKNNPASRIMSLVSFNPAKVQFKDMPAEFGDVNYMINNDDSIFVIQSNRCSSVPVNRNIITDGGGAESLVAARQVLGTERYYAGNYGCDDNPESVCDIGNTVYFASKSNRQVYKFNPSTGVQVISNAGMKSYFKTLFEKAESDREAGFGEIRVVGGYDPFEDTYILSVYNQNTEEGTCGDNEYVPPEGSVGEDDNGNGGQVEIVTETEFVYPESVTISLTHLLSNFDGSQLFDIAADQTNFVNIFNPETGSFEADSSNAQGFNDGSISSADLLRFLTYFGDSFEPASDLQTYQGASQDVTFNFPDTEE